MTKDKKIDFGRLFSYAFGCIGSIGVIATSIAVFVSLRNPDIIIHYLENRVSTSTPIVVQIQGESEEPVQNISSTETIEPITEPTIEPSILLPFMDKFDNGLKNEWEVTEGTPFFKNGRMGAIDDQATIQIGDDSLQDFILELDYYDFNNQRGIKITFSDIYFWLDYDGYQWYKYEDNEWKMFINDRFSPPAHVDASLRITVTGNNYLVHQNSEPLIEIRQGEPHRGPIKITIDEDAFFDNVVISPN